MPTTGGSSFQTATPIVKAEGTVWRSDQTTAAGLTTPHKGAYWRYTPTTSGTLRFTNVESDAGDTQLGLYKRESDGSIGIIQFADDNAPNGHETITYEVTAGVTYYMLTLLYSTSGALNYYILTVDQGPASTDDGGSPVNSHLYTQVDVPVEITGTLNYTATPASYHLAGTITAALTLNGTGHYSGPALPQWTVDLSAPDDQATVVSSTTRFMVGVDLTPDQSVNYTIEVQYADNADFTGATTVSDTANTGDGGALIAPAGPLSGTVHWRARVLVDDSAVTDWTDARSFTVSAAVAAVTIPVSWTVDASKKAPIHLWHFYPAGPSVGDTVTIFGHGFPTQAGGYILYGGYPLTALSWTKVNAQPGGVIEGGDVNPEHWEVTFKAPNYFPGTGAVLTVSDKPEVFAS